MNNKAIEYAAARSVREPAPEYRYKSVYSRDPIRGYARAAMLVDKAHDMLYKIIEYPEAQHLIDKAEALAKEIRAERDTLRKIMEGDDDVREPAAPEYVTPTMRRLIEEADGTPTIKQIDQLISWYENELDEIEWQDGRQLRVPVPVPVRGTTDQYHTELVTLPKQTAEGMTILRHVRELCRMVTGYVGAEYDSDTRTDLVEACETDDQYADLKYTQRSELIAFSLVRLFDLGLQRIGYDFEWLHEIERDYQKRCEAESKMTEEQLREHYTQMTDNIINMRVPGNLTEVKEPKPTYDEVQAEAWLRGDISERAYTEKEMQEIADHLLRAEREGIPLDDDDGKTLALLSLKLAAIRCERAGFKPSTVVEICASAYTPRQYKVSEPDAPSYAVEYDDDGNMTKPCQVCGWLITSDGWLIEGKRARDGLCEFCKVRLKQLRKKDDQVSEPAAPAYDEKQTVIPDHLKPTDMLYFRKPSGRYRVAEPAEVLALAAEIEMPQRGEKINSPDDTQKFLQLKLSHLEHEVFCMVLLDNRHRVIAFVEMFRGTIDGTSVYPREIVKEALRQNAAAIILAHNHPSGIAEPSQADERITKRLKSACELVDIRVLDHIIIAGEGSVSLAARGQL
jgi:DNA repair protein RadC